MQATHELTDRDVAGKHKVLVAGHGVPGFSKKLWAVVEIDKFGGHRHYFVCQVLDEVKLTTESLAAATRWYNKQGDEA